MGVAMAAGIAVVISQLMVDSQKTQKNLELSIEVASIFGQIEKTLGQNKHCVATFEGYPLPADGTVVPIDAIILKSSNPAIPDIPKYRVGNSADPDNTFVSRGSKLQIKEMKAYRSSVSENAVNFEIEIAKPSVGQKFNAVFNPGAVRSQKKIITLDAIFDGAGNIQKCYSQLATTKKVHCDSLGGFFNGVDCELTRGDCELKIRDYLMRGYPNSKVICGQTYYPYSTI